MGDVIKLYEGEHGLADERGRENTELLAFAKYQDPEKAADRTAAKIKEGFMEMGYILKAARDTGILAGSGYVNHEEFAEKRYGLDKGTVSRYIRIVERFSVGGSSHTLQEGYKNIGFAKLSLMLHMPDAIAEEITENYSKQEVQEIKEEIDAERQISDIEVAIEAAEAPQEEGSLLERALRQLGKEQPGLFGKLCRAVRDSVADTRMIAVIIDILAPQGDAVYMVRIPGTGRLMLAVSGSAASVTNVRSGEKEKYAAEELMAAVVGITSEVHEEPAAESAEAMPEEQKGAEAETILRSGQETAEKKQKEVAPVQLKEKRKESKVIKAAPPRQTAKKMEKAVAETVPPEPEASLPGQMEVMDYPEAYPMGDAACGDLEKQIPDVHYEEILDGNDTQTTVPGKHSGAMEPGLAAGAQAIGRSAESGMAAAVEEQLSTEKGTAGLKDREGAQYLPVGTAASTEENAEYIRMEADGCLERLRKTFTIWDGEIPLSFLVKAHQDTIDLAAAIERLMDIRKRAIERSERF